MFDKTGTLTEEGLSVLGFRPTDAVSSTDVIFNPFTENAGELTPSGNWWAYDEAA